MMTAGATDMIGSATGAEDTTAANAAEAAIVRTI